jgi:hypothetical protein
VIISPSEYEKIKSLYQDDLIPIIKLAETYGVTRAAIYKVLKKVGVDTSKKGGMEVTCATCGEFFKKPRCQVRVRNNLFCSQECWYKYVNREGKYSYSRQGQRRGRKVVSRYHTLQPGEIVHHEDKNCRNNTLANLRVFACQSDHIRYHRGFDVVPVWNGVDIIADRLKKK